MGNEPSTLSGTEDDLYQNNPTHPLHRKSTGKHLIDSDDDEADEHDHSRVSLRRRGASGSLKGSVFAAAATDGPSSSSFVDPVLSAAAAGAAARKAKQTRRMHSNPFRQHSKDVSNNEWRMSLQRLAKTAASTATNMAHVTAPMLADASSIVVESAKEFATDVHDEFTKPKYFEAEDGAESVIMFPYSPGRSLSGRSWYSPFAGHDPDLSPTTPNTGQSDSMGRVRLDLKVKNRVPLAPSLKPTPSTVTSEESVPTQQQEREPKSKSRRSVQIVHFPELAKLHSKAALQGDVKRALPEAISNDEVISAVQESKVSSTIDHRNGGKAISKSHEKSDERNEFRRSIDSGAVTATSQNSAILAGKPSKDSEDITFVALADAVKDDECKRAENPAIENTSPEMHDGARLEEKEEIEFATVNGANRNGDLDCTNDFPGEDITTEKNVGTKSKVSEEIEFNAAIEDFPVEDRTREKSVGTEFEESEEIEFTLARDDELKPAKDFASKKLDETAFTSINGAVRDINSNHAEDSANEGTIAKMLIGTTSEASGETAPIALSDTVKEDRLKHAEDSAAEDLTDEKKSSSEPGGQIYSHANQVVEESNRGESPSADDIKDLDIFDEFQQLVESAAKEGVFFSLDNEDSMAAMDFDGVNAEIERELEESSDSLEKELEALKSLEKVPEEPASIIQEEKLVEPAKLKILTTTETKSTDENAVFEMSFKTKRDDEDFSHIVREVPSNDSDVSHSEAKSPSKKNYYQDVSSPMRKSGVEQELRDLLARVENGEVVDEDRLSELDLFERYQSGEKLTADEMEDLGSILKSTQNLNRSNSTSIDEKSDHGEKSNLPSLFETSDNGDHKIINHHVGDGNKIPIGHRSESAYDANNHACENLRANETEKFMTATSSDTENSWLYWSVGRKGSESSQISTERLTSILSVADPEAIPDKGIEERFGWSTNEEVSHAYDGWRYWAHVGDDTGDDHQIELEETNLLPQDPTPILRIGIETITKTSSPFDGPAWLYWSHIGLPAEVGQPEHDVHTSMPIRDAESINDLKWPEILASSPKRETVTNSESGWRYWALLEKPGESMHGLSNLNGTGPLRHTTRKPLIKGEQSNDDSVSVAQKGGEGAPLEELLPLPISGPQIEGALWCEDSVAVLRAGEEDASHEESLLFSVSEALNERDQSNEDSVRIMQNEEDQTRVGESLSLTANSAPFDTKAGWMFWSMLGEGSSQNIVEENKSLWDSESTMAPHELQLETKRAEDAEHADKPAWLHWAQLDDVKASEAKSPFHYSISRSEVQEVPSPPSVDPAWIYWSTAREEKTHKAVKDSRPSWEVDRTTAPDDDQLDKNRATVTAGNEDKPEWLQWAHLDQPQTSDPEPSERESVQVSGPQSLKSQPFGSTGPIISTPGWLYWSKLEKHQAKKVVESRSLSWDFLVGNAPQEVQIHRPRTDVVGEQTSKPGWLHWAQIDQPKAPDSKLPQHNPGSVTEGKATGDAPNEMALRADNPGWLYWSTMGRQHIENKDKTPECSTGIHDSTVPNEVHLQKNMAHESAERKWLFWAQIGAAGSRLLDSNALQSGFIGNPHREEILSESKQQDTSKRSNVAAQVEDVETDTSKIVTRGMKTRSQANKHSDAGEPLTIGNSRVARDLHTSYNPVILKIESRSEEESGNGAQENERTHDAFSDLEHGEILSTNVSYSSETMQKEGGPTDGKTSRHQEEDHGSSHPQTSNAKTETDVNGDEDLSNPSQSNVDGENVGDQVENNASSSLKEAVSIFRRISAESRHAINSLREKRTPGPLTDESHILQDAQRLSKVASDLAGEVLRNGHAWLLPTTNESFGKTTDLTSVKNEKSSKSRGGIDADIGLQSEQSSTEFSVDLLNNSKRMLNAVVSKLTINVSINEKQERISLNRAKTVLPDSIFKYEISDRSPTTLSSVESVPIEDSARDLDKAESENDIAFSWDLMPTKREVRVEQHQLELSVDNSMVGSSSRVDGEVSLPMQKPRAGTKTKALDNASNHGSVDSEVLSPMMSPKSRRSKRLSRNLVKLQSDEFDTLSCRLELELDSADSSVVGGPSSVTGVKGFDQMNDPESLGLALVSFSSIDSIEFLNKIPRAPRKEEESRSPLFWGVLIANWKHSQIWKSMTRRSLSLDDDWLERDSMFEECGGSTSSSSTIRFQFRNKQVNFSSSGRNKLKPPDPQFGEASTLILSEYLCDIGAHQLGFEDQNEEYVIRHALAQNDAAPTDINSLLKLAESHLQSLAKLLGDIVAFASLETSRSRIKHSIGLKRYTAIRKKADRKYGGDISQVKDILRAQVTFPDETSLICGLLCLHRRCNNTSESKEMPQFEIVRLKNYFRTIDGSDPSLSPMPTGYRHVLINIRIAGFLIAGKLQTVIGPSRESNIPTFVFLELQFQLAQIFEIMGTDGYLLHSEFSSSFGVGNSTVGGLEGKSSGRSIDVFGFVNNILLVDHIKDSKQTAKEEQQIKVRRVEKKGEIGAIAAAAARERNGNNLISKPETEQKKADEGIGAAAAAAAKNTEPKGSKANATQGGIGALAAAAAQARNGGSQMSTKKQEENKPVGGIGAAAAVAARRSKMKNFKAISKGGGIAVIAAAVAEERNEGKASPKSEQDGQTVDAGIGAAAARSSKMNDFEANSKESGIGAMATAVAGEHNGGELTKKKEEKKPVEGIGAAAAAAARERNGNNLISKPETEQKKADEGIGAAAAAAAKNTEPKGSKANAAQGGIGALAAAAAQARNGGSQMSTKKQEENKPVGGIGAAAAAAARRSKMKNFKAISKGGGIAVIAAAVAEERNGRNSTPKSEEEREKVDVGIGAAAAAAAAARSSKMNGSNAIMGGAGIATIAAAAAKNRASYDGASESILAEKNLSQANASTSFKNSKTSVVLNYDTVAATKTREIDLIKEAIDVGIEEATSNPRNLPAFYCLYLLLRRLEEIDPDYFSIRRDGSSEYRPSMRSIKTMLLTRSLAISNQASSLGMLGWLEYGSSNVVERQLGLPIEMMQRLAFDFASSGDWKKASDVLSSCVLRCQEHLPLHHPTTLCAMIDLAGTYTMTSMQSEAKAMIKTVSDIVGEFLAECEAAFFEDMSKLFSFERDREQILFFERKTNAVSLLTTFATDFNSLLFRDFLGIMDPNHHVTLLNHSLVANSFAVLASCLAASQSIPTTEAVTSESSLRYWSLACLHYQHSLRGWTKLHSLSHPNATSAAFSIARCLRELGKIDESICILESLLECLQHSSERDDFGDNELDIEPKVLGSVSFLPSKSGLHNGSGVSIPECRREQTIVLCLWTLAAFVVQRNPDEEARVHALKLLHQASDILRNLLYHADEMHGNTQRVCLELYNCVEEEARVLFEPVRMAQMQTSEFKDHVMMAHQSSLTSMRRKRWFQQQSTASISQQTYPVHQFI
ncbi:unnamed protein product [Cylindrotheca closterium]|uniref:Uncharacterized protein n=1 Tax=Cylindrotheca closterium TaxID=2856 RepID=A0AAD2FIF7_9STRA|nr:unnamed protein product [Cylindrotheca closterium]